MSKIITLTGAQVATNVQVEQQTAKLKFHFRTPDAQAADWATLMTRMNAVIVDVELQSKAGRTMNLIPKVPMGKLAEMYSVHEGEITVKDNGTDHDVEFSVELGTTGALPLGVETNIVINITGMVANDILEVYAFDFPILSSTAIKVNNVRFNSGAAKSLSLQQSAFLHLVAASFDKLELFYANGRVITLAKKELEQWLIEGNGTQGNLVGLVRSGFIEMYCINVADAYSAEVTTTADVNGYVFTHEKV